MTISDIEKARAGLIFIEFQHEWLAEDGILQQRLILDKPAFQAAVANAARVLEAARGSGWTIAHAGLDLSRDPHYRIFNGGREVLGLRQAIPNARTWREAGSRYVEPFVPRDGEFVLAGRSGASVLKNSTLDPFLRNADINTLFLMGFATHVCVESTLREAHDLGYNAYVVHDACAAFEAAQQDYVRKHVIRHFGGETDTASLVARMQAV